MCTQFMLDSNNLLLRVDINGALSTSSLIELIGSPMIGLTLVLWETRLPVLNKPGRTKENKSNLMIQVQLTQKNDGNKLWQKQSLSKILVIATNVHHDST